MSVYNIFTPYRKRGSDVKLPLSFVLRYIVLSIPICVLFWLLGIPMVCGFLPLVSDMWLVSVVWSLPSAIAYALCLLIYSPSSSVKRFGMKNGLLEGLLCIDSVMMSVMGCFVVVYMVFPEYGLFTAAAAFAAVICNATRASL